MMVVGDDVADLIDESWSGPQLGQDIPGDGRSQLLLVFGLGALIPNFRLLDPDVVEAFKRVLTQKLDQM